MRRSTTWSGKPAEPAVARTRSWTFSDPLENREESEAKRSGMIPETIVASALYGCPDANLELGYRVVVEVLRPTNEPNLATPEYEVRIFDHHQPDGWTANVPEFDFDDSYLRAITSAERDRRIADLHQKPTNADRRDCQDRRPDRRIV